MHAQIVTPEAFHGYVVDAFKELPAGTSLQTHVLADLLNLTGQNAGDELRGVLLSAIENLRPTGDDDSNAAIALRHYRHIVLRYVEGRRLSYICATLGVSGRQARRDHQDAMDTLSALLWQRYEKLQVQPSNQTADRQQPLPNDVPRCPGMETSGRKSSGLANELDLLAPTLASELAPLEEIMSSALKTVASLATTNHVAFALDVPRPLATVPVNRSAVRQSIVHLLVSIAEHCADDRYTTSMTIRADAADDFSGIVVEVIIPLPIGDDGRRSRLEADERIGIAERLLKLVGGRLAAQTDQGDRLLFRLDLPTVRPVTVLVIDDNLDMLRLFHRYLVGTQYRLLQATTGDRVMSLLETERPDVVVLDVLMPTQDGWEILQVIRGSPSGATIPVIVCSVLREQSLALSLGATDFLMKPLTRSALLRMLAQHASAPEALPMTPSGTASLRLPPVPLAD